jgi:hypothetical protein
MTHKKFVKLLFLPKGNGKGNCISRENCLCQNGFSGQYCQIPSCNGISAINSNVCNGHGTCVDFDTCNYFLN